MPTAFSVCPPGPDLSQLPGSEVQWKTEAIPHHLCHAAHRIQSPTPAQRGSMHRVTSELGCLFKDLRPGASTQFKPEPRPGCSRQGGSISCNAGPQQMPSHINQAPPERCVPSLRLLATEGETQSQMEVELPLSAQNCSSVILIRDTSPEPAGSLRQSRSYAWRQQGISFRPAVLSAAETASGSRKPGTTAPGTVGTGPGWSFYAIPQCK